MASAKPTHLPATRIWPTMLALFLLTIVAQLSNVAFESFQSGQAFLPKLLPSLVFLSVITLPAILMGATLGKKMGLGIINSRAKDCQQQAMLFAVVGGVLLGGFLLVLRWLLQPYLPSELPDYGFRGPIGGLLVSLGAGIGEEVWFRFGLMTLLLWLLLKLLNKEQPNTKAASIAILFTAFFFGLAHIPNLTAYGAASPFAISATILGNMSVSALFGWCYWRYGLLSAMVAHISVDIVLHSLPGFL